MKWILLAGFAMLSTCWTASAQDTGKQSDRLADLSFGLGNNLTNLSLAYQWGWRLGKKQRLRLGFGVRTSRFSTADKYFVTAPANIVKGVTGPGVLFKEPITANMDSVQLTWARSSTLNVLIHISQDITAKLSAGFNIDVVGFSFGNSSPGTYINGNAADGIYTKPVTATPSTFNLLLIGENDLGSLTSEFFLKYSIKERLAVKAGVQHLFIEYTTDTHVQQFPEPNHRFRITPTVAMVGVILTIR